MSVADAYFTDFFKKLHLIRHCDTFQKSEYSSKNAILKTSTSIKFINNNFISDTFIDMKYVNMLKQC